jgi:hypothetical protein
MTGNLLVSRREICPKLDQHSATGPLVRTFDEETVSSSPITSAYLT